MEIINTATYNIVILKCCEWAIYIQMQNDELRCLEAATAYGEEIISIHVRYEGRIQMLHNSIYRGGTVITASKALAFMLPRYEADWVEEKEMSEYLCGVNYTWVVRRQASVNKCLRQPMVSKRNSLFCSPPFSPQPANSVSKKHKLTFLLPEHFAGLFFPFPTL